MRHRLDNTKNAVNDIKSMYTWVVQLLFPQPLVTHTQLVAIVLFPYHEC